MLCSGMSSGQQNAHPWHAQSVRVESTRFDLSTLRKLNWKISFSSSSVRSGGEGPPIGRSGRIGYCPCLYAIGCARDISKQIGHLFGNGTFDIAKHIGSQRLLQFENNSCLEVQMLRQVHQVGLRLDRESEHLARAVKQRNASCYERALHESLMRQFLVLGYRIRSLF